MSLLRDLPVLVRFPNQVSYRRQRNDELLLSHFTGVENRLAEALEKILAERQDLPAQTKAIIALLKSHQEQLRMQQEQGEKQQEYINELHKLLKGQQQRFQRQQTHIEYIEEQLRKYEHLLRLYTDHQIWQKRAELADAQLMELRMKIRELEREKRKGLWERLLDRIFGKEDKR